MEESVQAITELLLAISLVALGLLFFVMIMRSLREFSFFESRTALIVAVCVTILSTIGIHEFFIAPGGPTEYTPTSSDTNIDQNKGFGGSLFLLPYAALAVAIVLSLSLLSVRRIIQCKKQRSVKEAAERRIGQVSSPERTGHERRFKY